MKVYAEDPLGGEITIAGVACRKLGELKNGEQKTFSVGQEALKIFVIADNLSKSFCNEYYSLPEGTEDVFLCGKNRFNPAAGNAFCFEGNDGEDIVKNRRSNTRRGLVVLIASALVGVVIGFGVTSSLFSGGKGAEKTFSDGGMSLVLTDEFRKVSVANYAAAYESKNVAVFALKEPFALVEGFGDYTLEEYRDLVRQANRLEAQSLQTDDGLIGFTYESANPETGEVYRYFAFVYKTGDAFWLVQFATRTETADRYADAIEKWAASARFSDTN